MKSQLLKKRVSRILMALVILYCLLNVGINVDNGAIFVIFDKWDVMNADKMVIRDDGKEIVITDTELIQKVTKATLIATGTDYKYPKGDRWIELYHKDKLVRRMQWSHQRIDIIVYENDASYWIFPSWEGRGFVDISWDLYEELNQLYDPE